MINLNNINVTLGKGTLLKKEILMNLNLTVKTGEFVVIIGGNGAGKSTLLNVIAGFIAPDQGEVNIDGQNIKQLSRKKRAQVVTLVMQDPKVGTIEQMTIEENLSFALSRGKTRRLRSYKNKQRLQLYREKLVQLNMGLENRMQEFVGSLSGGERQALSLIMAKMTDSKILLLDEITAALDPKMAASIMQITAKLVREKNRTTLMITHNMQHALQYGDRTMVLKDGKIQQIYGKHEKAKLTAGELAASFEV